LVKYLTDTESSATFPLVAEIPIALALERCCGLGSSASCSFSCRGELELDLRLAVVAAKDDRGDAALVLTRT
jgi:hypothetical protein